MNAPQLPSNPFEPGNGGSDPSAVPMGGPNPNQVTTKPRQMPGGGGMDFDPKANGGDVQLGDDDSDADDQSDNAPSVTSSPDSSARVAAIAEEVRRTNPGITPWVAHRIAKRVFEDYLTKEAWSDNPLGQVSWTHVEDGPITNRLGPERGIVGPRRPKVPAEPQLGEPPYPEATADDEPTDDYESWADQPHDTEPVDLNEWDKPAAQRHPVVRRLIRQYGPEIAKTMWQMRRGRM